MATRTRRSIIASLALTGAAAGALTMTSIAQANTATPTDEVPTIIEDTINDSHGSESTAAPVDPTLRQTPDGAWYYTDTITQEADPATDPTLRQTPDGAWYYTDTITQEADPATDPTLRQTPDGAWYYTDTITPITDGQR